MSSNYKYILFDLDGTLSDSSEGLINSVVYACDKWNLHDYTKEELLKFIGPPIHVSFRNKFHLSPEKADEIVKDFRIYYNEKGKFENVLYPGISDLLVNLKARDFKLSVATSKPTYFTEEILEYFNIRQYFDAIIGSSLDNKFFDKGEIIKSVLNHFNPTSLSECLMVGDTKFDILGAKQSNIDCAAVLYGFGSIEEFNEYHPNYIFETVAELNNFLLK